MNNRIFFLSIFCVGCLFSCNQEFLDQKPDKALLVPKTSADFQALLDYTTIMNVSPGLPHIASDEFYTTDEVWQTLLPDERNTYIWAADIYEGNTNRDWSDLYKQVFYANIVLDGLERSKGNLDLRVDEELKGSALFFRSFAFYNLALTFSMPYQEHTAASELGIPLRLTADVNATSVRSSLKETYNQIIGDLVLAESLLSTAVPVKSRPSKTAAQALLARVFLGMGRYDDAFMYANRALQYNSDLIDYNHPDTTVVGLFQPVLPNGNPEVIFYSGLIATTYSFSPLTSVDTTVFNAYEPGDLRKSVFFRNRGNGVFTFKGTYSGYISGFPLFGGFANDELYLIRAECRARKDDLIGAQDDLNNLLENRYESGMYEPFVHDDKEVTLDKILMERRKQLLGRGLRWYDLKRLNSDPQFATTLTRVIGGNTYTLPPNDKRYAFPIPDEEVLGSGLQQNPR